MPSMLLLMFQCLVIMVENREYVKYWIVTVQDERYIG